MNRRSLTLWLLVAAALLLLGGIGYARKASTTESNKALSRRFVEEFFNKGNPAIADELVAANYVEHTPFPGQAPGREGLKQGLAIFRTAFPAFHADIEELVAEGDKVVSRSTWHGTHKGTFMGVAPTGKSVTVSGLDMLRIVNGKVVEHWGYEDDMGLMQQLGAMPPPGSPAK